MPFWFKVLTSNFRPPARARTPRRCALQGGQVMVPGYDSAVRVCARRPSNVSRALLWLLAVVAGLLSIPQPLRAQSLTSVSNLGYQGGTSPFQGYITNAIAINTQTNKVYLALQNVSTPGSAGLIAVLNGTTYNGSTSEVATIIQDTSSDAYQPYAIAIDPVTNVIYVANTGGGSGNGSLTVIDGATDTYVGNISDPGSTPRAILVNSATNTVYLANYAGNSVTVCSGATRPLSGPITIGSQPPPTTADG